MIVESPALPAREREVFAAYPESLAAAIAAEPGAGGEVEARVAAGAMIGAHRALVDRQAADRRGRRAENRGTRGAGAREAALGLLERGFGGDAVRRGPGRPPRAS